MRALAWQEPVGAGGRLDMNADGAIDQLDLAAAVSTLLQQRLGESPLAVHLESTAVQAVLKQLLQLNVLLMSSHESVALTQPKCVVVTLLLHQNFRSQRLWAPSTTLVNTQQHLSSH